MNISSQLPTLPIATVNNPATDTLRRENNQRELITQPTPVNPSAAEKGVASDKSKGRTPTQLNEHIAFADIQKNAEQANKTIGGSNQEEKDSSSDAEQQDAEPEKDIFEVFAEEKQIHELQQRDREVRSHELAHSAVGGATTGSPKFSFETGPDGKKYAVEGEVSVDLSVIKGNPQATITKMQRVHAAALAPANPSAQDTRVAASAAKIIAQAQAQLLSEEIEDPHKVDPSIRYIKPVETFAIDEKHSSHDDELNFDTLINKTLKAQESSLFTQSQDVLSRALRIENFYQTINRAYEKPPSSHFEIQV